MQKLPYIKIYPGDDLKMCGHLPLDVYGGYMKLRFKMWDSQTRGRVRYEVKQLMRVMGADNLNHTDSIINELCNEHIINKIEENGVKWLVDPEMEHSAKISKVRSETGAEGGKKTQANNKAKRKQTTKISSDFALANNKAKMKQNCEYDIDNENEYVLEQEEGGTGDETIRPAHPPGNSLAAEPSRYPTTLNSLLSKEDCLKYFFTDLCTQQRHLHLISRPVLKNDEDLLWRWGEAFNLHLINKGESNKLLKDWCSHFFNWTKTQDLSTEPENIFKNDTSHRNTNNTRPPANNGANYARGGATVTDLQNLKRGGATGDDERTDFAEFTVVT